MLINNKLYDVLKWICLIVIPALITFLGVLLPVFEVDPETVKIVITIISASGTFLGTLIGISTATRAAAQPSGAKGAWINESKNTADQNRV